MMTTYVALLRAVNVGGTGKLPMDELKAMCDRAGFAKARTYIASGNAIFEAEASEAEVKATLGAALKAYAGKEVGLLVRTAAEMAEVLKNNPFPDAEPSKVVAVFLDAPPKSEALAEISGARGEELALGNREIYVHYPDGMGRSKLKIPAAKDGTARNMNTVARLSEIAAAL